jgi:hypothetical protein
MGSYSCDKSVQKIQFFKLKGEEPSVTISEDVEKIYSLFRIDNFLWQINSKVYLRRKNSQYQLLTINESTMPNIGNKKSLESIGYKLIGKSKDDLEIYHWYEAKYKISTDPENKSYNTLEEALKDTHKFIDRENEQIEKHRQESNYNEKSIGILKFHMRIENIISIERSTTAIIPTPTDDPESRIYVEESDKLIVLNDNKFFFLSLLNYPFNINIIDLNEKRLIGSINPMNCNSPITIQIDLTSKYFEISLIN